MLRSGKTKRESQRVEFPKKTRKLDKSSDESGDESSDEGSDEGGDGRCRRRHTIRIDNANNDSDWMEIVVEVDDKRKIKVLSVNGRGSQPSPNDDRLQLYTGWRQWIVTEPRQTFHYPIENVMEVLDNPYRRLSDQHAEFDFAFGNYQVNRVNNSFALATEDLKQLFKDVRTKVPKDWRQQFYNVAFSLLNTLLSKQYQRWCQARRDYFYGRQTVSQSTLTPLSSWIRGFMDAFTQDRDFIGLRWFIWTLRKHFQLATITLMHGHHSLLEQVNGPFRECLVDLEKRSRACEAGYITILQGDKEQRTEHQVNGLSIPAFKHVMHAKKHVLGNTVNDDTARVIFSMFMPKPKMELSIPSFKHLVSVKKLPGHAAQKVVEMLKPKIKRMGAKVVVVPYRFLKQDV